MAERQRYERIKRATILGVLLALVIVFTIFGYVVQWRIYYHSAQIAAAKSDITLFVRALQAFYADTGHYPPNAQGLEALVQNVGNDHKWKGPYLNSETS